MSEMVPVRQPLRQWWSFCNCLYDLMQIGIGAVVATITGAETETK